MTQKKAVLRLLGATFLYPSSFMLGMIYGWWLPPLIILIVIGLMMTKESASTE